MHTEECGEAGSGQATTPHCGLPGLKGDLEGNGDRLLAGPIVTGQQTMGLN